ncbi:MAG: hypothetical protein GXY58_01985 [Planctomycetaceae bacterium]|nr:hypothetical protein [Planctomycetaceae bacterium]
MCRIVLVLALAVVATYPVTAAEVVSSAATSVPGVVGDGVHDDTLGLQSLLDSGRSEIHFPVPPVHLLISKTLRVHSGQTLIVGRHTVIRLKDGSDQVMITNADHDQGNEDVSVVGGIWDMNNLNQSLTEYQKTRDARGRPYAPEYYIGVLMRFNNVKNLSLRGLTLKDPVTFGMQLGNLRQFTIEDITFDYNLKRTNMDGVHVHGNSRWGRIANLKGTTNDDLVALNADDGGCFEMARGPIEDVSVGGVFSQDGYTAVRLLSAGSPIRRIQLANVFGTYRYNVISFTNHQVHPGSASTFEDISIRGIFCSKSGKEMEFDPLQSGGSSMALIWIDAPAVVSSLTISDYHRTESVWPAENIVIEPEATVECLQMNNVSVINHTPGAIHVLTNNGMIGYLGMTGVYAKAEGDTTRGSVVSGSGVIRQQDRQNVFTVNVDPGLAK